MSDKYEEETYTPNSWADFAEKLNTAKAVQEDLNASQEVVDDAVLNLINARVALQMRAQKGVLNAGILCAESLDTEHNTPATVAALNKALEKAKEVSDNLNATQKEVNDASNALYTAINNLLDIVDNSKLVKLLEAAQNLDTSKYTAETAEAFNAAVEAAVKVSENKDATLEEINKAYSDLAYAMMNDCKSEYKRTCKYYCNGRKHPQ